MGTIFAILTMVGIGILLYSVFVQEEEIKSLHTRVDAFRERGDIFNSRIIYLSNKIEILNKHISKMDEGGQNQKPATSKEKNGENNN